MRRLRIAFVSTGNFPHIRPYLDFFQDRGHEVHWVTYTRPTSVPGVEIHDVSRDIDPLGTRRAKSGYLLSVPRLRRLWHGLRPDIVHGHYATSAGLLCLLSGFRPYVLTVHGSDLMSTASSRVWRFLLKRAFASAALVHTVSRQLADMVEHMGIPAARCLVATHGVELSKFPYCPARDQTPLELICTRQLRAVHDQATIIQACALLKSRGIDFKLTLAAGGPLLPSLQEQVSAAGLSGSVSFLGGYDNESLVGMFSRSHLYISSSLWDGTSISLLEAMACGVFPVVSRIPSNEAWLRDGADGLMFEAGNALSLADALERGIRDHQLRAGAMRRNREMVEQRADRVSNLARLEQGYEAILDNRFTADHS